MKEGRAGGPAAGQARPTANRGPQKKQQQKKLKPHYKPPRRATHAEGAPDTMTDRYMDTDTVMVTYLEKPPFTQRLGWLHPFIPAVLFVPNSLDLLNIKRVVQCSAVQHI